MISRSTIYLPGGDGRLQIATLRTDLSKRDLENADDLWLPVQQAQHVKATQLGKSLDKVMEHDRWVWSRKWIQRTNRTLHLGVEIGVELQGITILQLGKPCRHTLQQGLPMVYVDYLATAPWNNSPVLELLGERARYKRVARILLRAAIDISHENGWNGRLGLFSLPQTETYYRDRCGMIDLGKEPDEDAMRYFEMTPEISTAFLAMED